MAEGLEARSLLAASVDFDSIPVLFGFLLFGFPSSLAFDRQCFITRFCFFFPPALTFVVLVEKQPVPCRAAL